MEKPADSQQPADRRPPVVVAEDDADTRRLLAAQLERAGYPVQACANGREALDAVRRLGSCIVVADWIMPEMDGLELCRAVAELRELGAIGSTYFILLTVHAEKENVVRGLGAGADEYITKPYHEEELLARVKAGERIYRLQRENFERRLELERINAELDVLSRKLEKLAHTDVLTGAANRRYVLERLNAAWQQAERGSRLLSVVLCDLDHFKAVNDAYGHAAGDAVLIETARRGQRLLRAYDVFGRFGGEEFLIICPDTDLAGAATVAERIRAGVAATHVVFEDIRIPVTISVGAASRQPWHRCPDELIEDADAMLYRAKENGRNQVWLATGRRAGRPLIPDLAAGPI
jgi:diguanylate cyclase (GGDEF)-like protein